jgi:hypothetical protein
MYKVKKKEKDFKDSLIEKKYEHTLTFTIADVNAHMEKLEKAYKEIDGQFMLAGAKVQNIEINHPFVKKMSEKDLFVVHMYVENLNITKHAQDKLREIAKQKSAYKRELKDIYKELGFSDEPEKKDELKAKN